MKRQLAIFAAILTVFSLCAASAARDCWNWSVSEQTLMVTLKSHTPNDVTALDIPDWYYPSTQSAKNAISAAVNALKAASFFGVPGGLAIVSAYERTGGLPVTAIGEHAFESYTSLRRVSFPEHLGSIGEFAFFHCYALESVEVPNPVTILNKGTFASCVALRDVTLPDGLTAIGTSAFEACSALYNINIPGSVKEIGYAAFSGCAALPHMALPDGLQTIGNYAYYECDGLEWVFIPQSVTSIGESAFFGCSPILITKNRYAIDFAQRHNLAWRKP